MLQWLINKLRGRRNPESNADLVEPQRLSDAELAELSEKERNVILLIRKRPLEEQQRLVRFLDFLIEELGADDTESD